MSAEDHNESGDRGDEVKRELSALKSLLRKTRRELRWPLLLEGAAWTAVTAGAIVVTAQTVGLLAGSHGPQVVRWVCGIGGASLGLSVLVAGVVYWRTQPTLQDVARRLQRSNSRFRDDISAALQFGEELVGEADDDRPSVLHGFSVDLAAAHVKRTTRMLLEQLDENHTLANHIPRRTLVPALLALGGCLALLLLPQLFWGERVDGLWNAALYGTADEKATKKDQRPLVGEIDVLLSFPPYTDRPPQFEPFTTGYIQTLVGTEVTLKTYPLLSEAEKYEIVVKTGEGARVVPMSKVSGRLEATLLLTKAGSYSFRAHLPDGTVVDDGIERTIELLPDNAPDVTVTSHPEEVEVSPDDVLEIEVEVEDDFGIESVARAWAFGSDDPTVRPLDLPELTTVPGSITTTFSFDLKPLALQPKDSVTVWVEATDNNSLTGPGIGKSTPIVLRVTSPEDRHMKVIADEAQVLEALLLVLAEFLENPAGEREPNKKNFYRQVVPRDLPVDVVARRFAVLNETHLAHGKVLAEMASVVERMKEDPLMPKRDIVLFEGLYEQLYQLNRDGAEVFAAHEADARSQTLLPAEFQAVANHAAKAEDALEKGLIRLEDLLAKQRMDAVKATAEDIRELRDRLKELLEQYRDTGDPELKKAIMREIQRLRQRMAEMMARMQSQLKQLPEQHVNMEALEQAKLESDAAKMGDNLQKIEDLIEQGDIDAALQALDDMTQNLDSMTDEMDQQFAGAESESMRELDKKLSELMDQANDLETRQRDIEQRTHDLQQELDERQRREMEAMLEEQTKRVEELAAEQRRRLEEIAQRDLAPHDLDAAREAEQRMQKLEEMLEARDIEQALEHARRSQEDLRSLEFSMDLSQRYTQKGTQRDADVRQTARDLGQMSAPGRQMVNELEDIMDQAKSRPNGSSNAELQQLAREQADAQQQAEALRQQVGEAAERFPMLEPELGPPLDEATKQMGGARQSLEGKKTQKGLDHQRAALESLRQLKQSMKDALQKQKQGGQKGQGRPGRKEKIAIPEKDGRSHEKFREDIMKGMKQDRLETYESEIERYYESLME